MEFKQYYDKKIDIFSWWLQFCKLKSIFRSNIHTV